jgi:hypothetical protein
MNTSKTARAKLSTTVAANTFEFLEAKVASGQASSIAEAVDRAIQKVRRLENRQRLATATARYFEGLEAHAAAEEDELAHSLALPASAVDRDKEL